ncbi:thioredoxin family protein [Mucilaginibacter litoreus]|uniref:Thioredoxin family protein n=1 Tax=Mucilaginibacter litoreus TaxID=1048221 RepID=A0ABW3AN77_9SPHI
MIITVQKVHAQRQDVTVNSPGINFKTEKWQNILAMAKRQHKQIFVDAYALWCAPCKQLKAQTFKDQKVADYFNRQFINVSIDIEKGDGLVLADEFDISAYPTLLWLDENGRLIKRSEGFMNAEQLLAMAKHEEKLN